MVWKGWIINLAENHWQHPSTVPSKVHDTALKGDVTELTMLLNNAFVDVSYLTLGTHKQCISGIPLCHVQVR